MALLSLTLILLQQTLVEGELINHTIDDTLGDESTGVQVDYSPAGQSSNGNTLVWRNASQCSDCAIVPDRSFAMNGTWTGATYYSSLENTTAGLTFHGSAIYIYLIVSNYPKSTGLVSDVICDFRMDGKVVGHYSHVTDGTYQFQYDVLAYSNASLNDGDHTLLIEITGSDSSYVIFDYAVYTYVFPVFASFHADLYSQQQSGVYHVSDYSKPCVDDVRTLRDFKSIGVPLLSSAFFCSS
ncbi:uncharacterized protein EV420DRAFT_1311059 [Desarmillaria tabescens]|uniref:Uncharacterized protein n=1 Tax=Armillaria tabescens TaxID=1929756 RepID=A0AA39K653_ARMTA|nr:uncharacterized protein EV420DRAFT_1311059 [Desarmillaria tabescens]KAK0454155.1 hypothetical protein EV420DRAFT_1311059 [Desarmillaria tabescens]